MQRFGFLKYLMWRASLSSTNNLSTLGKDLIAAVTQKVSYTLSAQLREYILTALTDPIYTNLRTIAAKSFEGNLEKPTVQVEIQDIYLSDSNLSSRRGKLVSDDWNRYPYLALDISLLRKGTYSLLVRGQSFLSLVSEEEKRAFNRTELKSLNGTVNPFQLTLPQMLILLFSVIEKDGDVLSILYSKLLSFKESFSVKDAGNYLPEIYRTIAKNARTRAKSGDDLIRIQKLLDTANKIEAVKQKPFPGGKNPREHAITVRLEPFVDFGLLFKPDPFAYLYQITDRTKYFFESIIHSEDIDYFLNHSFFDISNEVFDIKGKHKNNREIIMPAMLKAYNILKSPLGYASILEVSLLSGIYSIIEKGFYFEIFEAIDTLKAIQKEKPEIVRFNVDRWGVLTFVKFNNNITKIFIE